jgi:hypothetical protein
VSRSARPTCERSGSNRHGGLIGLASSFIFLALNLSPGFSYSKSLANFKGWKSEDFSYLDTLIVANTGQLIDKEG